MSDSPSDSRSNTPAQPPAHTQAHTSAGSAHRGRPKMPPSGSYSTSALVTTTTPNKPKSRKSGTGPWTHGRSLSHTKLPLKGGGGGGGYTASGASMSPSPMTPATSAGGGGGSFVAARPHLGRSKSTDGLVKTRNNALKRSNRSLTKLAGLQPLTKTTSNQSLKSNKSRESLKGMAVVGLKRSGKKERAILRLNDEDDDEEYEDVEGPDVVVQPFETGMIESVPVELATLDSAPVDSVPVDSVPVDSVSVESAPLESAQGSELSGAGSDLAATTHPANSSTTTSYQPGFNSERMTTERSLSGSVGEPVGGNNIDPVPGPGTASGSGHGPSSTSTAAPAVVPTTSMDSDSSVVPFEGDAGEGDATGAGYAYGGSLLLSQSTGVTKKFNNNNNGTTTGNAGQPTLQPQDAFNSRSISGISFRANPMDDAKGGGGAGVPGATGSGSDDSNSYQPGQTIYNNLRGGGDNGSSLNEAGARDRARARARDESDALEDSATAAAAAAAAAAAVDPSMATFQDFLKHSNKNSHGNGHSSSTSHTSHRGGAHASDHGSGMRPGSGSGPGTGLGSGTGGFASGSGSGSGSGSASASASASAHDNRTQQRLWLQRENSLMDVPGLDPTHLGNFSNLSLSNLMFDESSGGAPSGSASAIGSGMSSSRQHQPQLHPQFQLSQVQASPPRLNGAGAGGAGGSSATALMNGSGSGGALSSATSESSLNGLLLNVQSSNSIQSRTEFERLNREYLNVRRNLNPVAQSLSRTREYTQSQQLTVAKKKKDAGPATADRRTSSQRTTAGTATGSGGPSSTSSSSPATLASSPTSTTPVADRSTNSFDEFSPEYHAKDQDITALVNKLWQKALISSTSSLGNVTTPLRISTQQQRPTNQRLQSYTQATGYTNMRSPQTPTTRAVKLAAASQQNFKKNDHTSVNIA
ncbi:hypothetical protein CAAN1_32S00188 [[Candida] anglica]|uniref:Uncharacterized protein n=1 Tax=[Candida] anglica TaxID=148631 RepID=A0ABP0EEX3_9ASCO